MSGGYFCGQMSITALKYAMHIRSISSSVIRSLNFTLRTMPNNCTGIISLPNVSGDDTGALVNSFTERDTGKGIKLVSAG